MEMTLVTLALLLAACVLLFGCISIEPKQEIKIKKVSVAPANFSELLDLNLSLECAVQTTNGTARLVTGPGAYRDELGNRAMVKRDGITYLRIFFGAQIPQDDQECQWVMVNESDSVYQEWFEKLGPMHESLALVPGSAFDCDLAGPNAVELYPSGHICWYFDIAP